MLKSNSRPFAVVEFQEKGQTLVSVVSKCWLSDFNTKCAWPTGIGCHIKLITHSPPEETWTLHECRLLKLCVTFDKANKAAKELRNKDKLDSSEIETTPIQKPARKRKKRSIKAGANKKLHFSSDSEESSSNASISGSDSDVTSPPGVSLFDSHPENQPSSSVLIKSNNNSVSLVLVASPPQTEPDTVNSINSDQTIDNADIRSIEDSSTIPVIHAGQELFSFTDILPGITAESQQFQKEILSKLVSVESHLLELLRRTNTVNEESIITSEQAQFKLPLMTSLDFDSFNEWIKEGNNKIAIIRRLQFLGGKNSFDIVGRVLYDLISNTLGKVISLTCKGKCAIRGLQNSKIQEVLYETVHHNHGYENLTAFEIDLHTKKWLKNCKDREGGRELRKHKQCQHPGLPSGLSEDDD